MIKIAFKIWGAANLIVFLVFAIALFPSRIGVGITALLYSSLFSLPAIAFLYLLLRFLQHVQGPVLFSWLVFFIGTAVSAFVAYYFFHLVFKEIISELNFILPLSFISGYSAVLIFSPALHYLFQTFQYERETETY